MNFLRRLSKVLQPVNTMVFLHIAYLVGIGVVSVVGKLFGARFLDETATKTNWKPPTGSQDQERMY